MPRGLAGDEARRRGDFVCVLGYMQMVWLPATSVPRKSCQSRHASAVDPGTRISRC